MKTRYTPGPWRKQSGTTYIAVHADAADFTLLLNASPEVGCPREEQEANAQLIAAAPELLEALECVVRLLETEDAHLANFGEVEAARAAIAKAKGTE